MGILRRLREWREDKDGTLIGPNIDADSVKTDVADSDSYLLSGNQTQEWSLIDQTGNSGTLDVDTTEYNNIQVRYIIAEPVTVTHDNNTNADYNFLQVSDSGITSVTGASEWEIMSEAFAGASSGVFEIANRAGATDRMSIKGNAGVRPLSSKTLLRGYSDDNAGALDSLQITCESVNSLEVWGREQ